MVEHVRTHDKSAGVFVFLASSLFIPGGIFDGTLFGKEMISLDAVHCFRREGHALGEFGITAPGTESAGPGRDAVIHKVGKIRRHLDWVRRLDALTGSVYGGEPVTDEPPMDLEPARQLSCHHDLLWRRCAGLHRNRSPFLPVFRVLEFHVGTGLDYLVFELDSSDIGLHPGGDFDHLPGSRLPRRVVNLEEP